ncbi:hypothetical protein AJ85_07605 [Alkalihalobacillus alcalophilus ATCC 27647 = CGMCC 1.3604]|uniref:YjcZ family sporulation protein n=1 Tax=Alkalihalobacillus alcalophilus ATCC 27647 = CGMCC 1.3604 TaxID=1218173 RepID=A0A094YZ84_ALKAL|nr:hypothetical protein BALCAV_0201945 [Alkalihalobacillus alcalophilus ATCC 27647 = CGMCC 1.3604]THG91016.1 hypothetical protein AJ85_07605 [Alkalihalobacillus alcalophilus ATCC 27647 = CGMCC 1.3604]
MYGYGSDCGCYDPCGYGYGAPAAPVAGFGGGYNKGFALIVVLFILLVIVGAACFNGGGPGPDCKK